MAIGFEEFLQAVPDGQKPFVAQLNAEMLAAGCQTEIKQAKMGYVLAYKWEKKSVFNWVFRKTGMQARIYGDAIGKNGARFASLPASMQKKMMAAPDCKRLMNPEACSPTCVQGYAYTLAGQQHQKCRNGGMLFPLTEETAPHIAALLGEEIAARKALA